MAKNNQFGFAMQRENFKLDAAAIYDPRARHQRVVVYNFNVPSQRLQDLDTFNFVRQVLETDFPANAPGVIVAPYFQLSAVYVLINTVTNEERIWSGSFHPRARDLAQLTVFRPFEPASFAQYALTHSDPDRVYNKLSTFVNGKDSVWKFDRLISVVISFQTTLHLTHSLFVRHTKFAEHGRAGQNKKNWKVFTTLFD